MCMGGEGDSWGGLRVWAGPAPSLSTHSTTSLAPSRCQALRVDGTRGAPRSGHPITSLGMECVLAGGGGEREKGKAGSERMVSGKHRKPHQEENDKMAHRWRGGTVYRTRVPHPGFSNHKADHVFSQQQNSNPQLGLGLLLPPLPPCSYSQLPCLPQALRGPLSLWRALASTALSPLQTQLAATSLLTRVRAPEGSTLLRLHHQHLVWARSTARTFG